MITYDAIQVDGEWLPQELVPCMEIHEYGIQCIRIH
jgi:hypothetical protein